jgi:hypothetical protein
LPFYEDIHKWAERLIRREAQINRALKCVDGITYIEIGVKAGKCFHQINSPLKIAVDPFKQPEFEPGEGNLFFEEESDVFFRDHAAGVFKDRRIDVAFVDGLHEFKQALRDVMNLIPYMATWGVIFIHDVNPYSREEEETRISGWVGDVWKVAYYLVKYRGDLRYYSLRSDWGIGVLTGIRESTSSEMPSDDILDSIKRMNYGDLEKNRKEMLNLKPGWYSIPHFSFFHKRI